MNPKPNDLPTHAVVPPIKIKNYVNRRRIIASVVLTMFMTFFGTVAILLLFAFMFAPQLSNLLWNTDATQNALHGTSAAVQNAQIIVDMTSTALAVVGSGQQDLIDEMAQREARLDAREADLIATDEGITASIFATQTADVVANEQQRTQAAINYNETQSAINQQSTLIAIQATSTQLALDNRAQATPTPENRPFELRDEVQFISHPDSTCTWQGVAGSVTNMQNSLTGQGVLQVRVLSDGIDAIVLIGDNLGLGDAYNWAIQLSNEVNQQTYFLRLETVTSEPLSPMVNVTFNRLCDQNLAVVNFVQIAPMGN